MRLIIIKESLKTNKNSMGRRFQGRRFRIIISALCTTSVLLTFFGFLTLGRNSLSGWFIPDAVTLFEAAVQDAQLPLDDIFFSYPSAAGLAVINALLVGICPLMPAVLNTILLVVAQSPEADVSRRWPPTFFLLLTPYYLAAALLPSKDLLVLALFIVSTRKFSQKNSLLTPLLLAVAMCFVRDGFGLILVFLFLYVTAMEKSGLMPWRAMIALALAFSLFWQGFDMVMNETFLYVRSVSVAEQGVHFDSDWSKPLGYALRLFGNATNLAFRPVFLDADAKLHVLSCFYWVSGLTLLCALRYCWDGMASFSGVDQRLGAIGIGCLLLVSVTPYVQPRYLLPVCFLIPFFSFTRIRKFLRDIVVAIVFSVIASVLYQTVSNYPPKPESSDFNF